MTREEAQKIYESGVLVESPGKSLEGIDFDAIFRDEELSEAADKIINYIAGSEVNFGNSASDEFNEFTIVRVGRDRIIAYAKTLPPFEEHPNHEDGYDPELTERVIEVVKALR